MNGDPIMYYRDELVDSWKPYALGSGTKPPWLDTVSDHMSEYWHREDTERKRTDWKPTAEEDFRDAPVEKKNVFVDDLL